MFLEDVFILLDCIFEDRYLVSTSIPESMPIYPKDPCTIHFSATTTLYYIRSVFNENPVQDSLSVMMTASLASTPDSSS